MQVIPASVSASVFGALEFFKVLFSVAARLFKDSLDEYSALIVEWLSFLCIQPDI